MKYFYLISAFLISTLTSFIVAVNSFSFEEDYFGATITTLNATDLIKDSRSVINTNLTNLNTDKLERSDWFATTSASQLVTLNGLTTANSLASIGTITSGTWHGSTLTAAYGGTGSTTLLSNSLLLGNGTGAIKNVNGYGTAGQLLTSNGSGNAPTWQTPTLDEGADYDWTGEHTGVGIVGQIIAYASSTTPTGFLLCDGSAVSTVTYARLFAVIGYTFGGSGGTFNLPDLRGRYPRMASATDGIGGAFASTGGATSTILTINQIPAHTHTDPTDAIAGAGAGSTSNIETKNNAATRLETGSAGGGQAHSNLDPYITIYYIIKY